MGSCPDARRKKRKKRRFLISHSAYKQNWCIVRRMPGACCGIAIVVFDISRSKFNRGKSCENFFVNLKVHFKCIQSLHFTVSFYWCLVDLGPLIVYIWFEKDLPFFIRVLLQAVAFGNYFKTSLQYDAVQIS